MIFSKIYLDLTPIHCLSLSERLCCCSGLCCRCWSTSGWNFRTAYVRRKRIFVWIISGDIENFIYSFELYFPLMNPILHHKVDNFLVHNDYIQVHHGDHRMFHNDNQTCFPSKVQNIHRQHGYHHLVASLEEVLDSHQFHCS